MHVSVYHDVLYDKLCNPNRQCMSLCIRMYYTTNCAIQIANACICVSWYTIRQMMQSKSRMHTSVYRDVLYPAISDSVTQWVDLNSLNLRNAGPFIGCRSVWPGMQSNSRRVHYDAWNVTCFQNFTDIRNHRCTPLPMFYNYFWSFPTTLHWL